MSRFLYKMIMRNPFPFLLTAIALMWTYPLAIFLLKYSMVKDLTFAGVIVIGAIIASIPLLIWWGIAWLINSEIMYKKTLPDGTIVYNQEAIGWKSNIMIGSFSSGVIGLISLTLCYLFNWNLKTFGFITIAFPIFRLVTYYAWERRIFLKHIDFFNP